MTNESHDPRETPPDPFNGKLLRVSTILKRVANSFAPDSEERQAVKDAALAYVAVFQHQSILKNYAKLKAACGGRLTEEMRSKLRDRGLDADELESELAAEIDADDDDEKTSSA